MLKDPPPLTRLPPTKGGFLFESSSSSSLFETQDDYKSSTSNSSSVLLRYRQHRQDANNALAAALAFSASSAPKMIVFDKDGTMGDCTASLQKWVEHMTEKILEILWEDYEGKRNYRLLDQFHEQIGWDPLSNAVKPSAPVAAGTWDDIVGLVYDFLLEHQAWLRKDVSISPELPRKWHEELGDLHALDTPLMDDLGAMLKHASQQMGYTVAICTSDDRKATDMAMKLWGIESLVSFSICGDEVTQGKPSSIPLLTLCERASMATNHTFRPQDCLVVGDTSSDTGMARAAKAGFCVGVLTGSGTAEQLLDTGADLVLPSVADIPALLQTLERLSSEAWKEL